MSRPSPEVAIVDAGLKASSVDSGMPAVWQRRTLRYTHASDEHGWVEGQERPPALGEKLLLVPGHCDPTINLYDWYVCVRGAGRGALADHRRAGLCTSEAEVEGLAAGAGEGELAAEELQHVDRAEHLGAHAAQDLRESKLVDSTYDTHSAVARLEVMLQGARHADGVQALARGSAFR